MRSYYIDIECNEKCLLCGAPSTTVRTWLNHYEKCNKKPGNTKLSDVISRKRDIVRTRKQKLDEIKAGNRVDDGNGGGKRKAENTGSQPQRRRFGVSVGLNSNANYRAVTMGMNIPIIWFHCTQTTSRVEGHSI
jgi:hypothetical protein